MYQSEAKYHIEQRLPNRLIESLHEMEEKYRDKGIRLFIFGSFARSQDRQTSDLDLGVQWIGKRSSKIFSDFCRDVHKLPTIRKIDVVDMEQVDEGFKNKVMKEAIFIWQGEEVL